MTPKLTPKMTPELTFSHPWEFLLSPLREWPVITVLFPFREWHIITILSPLREWHISTILSTLRECILSALRDCTTTCTTEAKQICIYLFVCIFIAIALVQHGESHDALQWLRKENGLVIVFNELSPIPIAIYILVLTKF